MFRGAQSHSEVSWINQIVCACAFNKQIFHTKIIEVIFFVFLTKCSAGSARSGCEAAFKGAPSQLLSNECFTWDNSNVTRKKCYMNLCVSWELFCSVFLLMWRAAALGCQWMAQDLHWWTPAGAFQNLISHFLQCFNVVTHNLVWKINDTLIIVLSLSSCVGLYGTDSLIHIYYGFC